MPSTVPFQQMMDRFGESLEWFKALPCSCYDPRQNYDAQRSCDKCEHGFVYRSMGMRWGLVARLKKSFEHPELGWIEVGQLTLNTLADECQFGPFDKVRLLRPARARARVAKADNSLGHTHILRVDQVTDDDTVYRLGYDFTVNKDTGVLTWLTAGPSNVYAADFTYTPIYWYVGIGLDAPRPWGDRDLTPQRGVLSLAPPGASGS